MKKKTKMILYKVNILLFTLALFLGGCCGQKKFMIEDNYPPVAFSYLTKTASPNFYITFSPDGKIQKLNINIDIQTDHQCEQKCRELLIIFINNFIKNINADTNAPKCFDNWPITPKNFNMSICFKDKDKNFVADGSISSITINEKEISFFKLNKDTKTLEKTLSESYEDADKVVDSNYQGYYIESTSKEDF
jgi:hypothetical protein